MRAFHAKVNISSENLLCGKHQEWSQFYSHDKTKVTGIKNQYNQIIDTKHPCFLGTLYVEVSLLLTNRRFRWKTCVGFFGYFKIYGQLRSPIYVNVMLNKPVDNLLNSFIALTNCITKINWLTTLRSTSFVLV
jgi:hypothetical protein